MSDNSKTTEQQNKETLERATKELAWLFVSIIEGNLDKKKLKEIKKNKNESGSKI